MADAISSFTNLGGITDFGKNIAAQWNSLGSLIGATGMFVLNCIIVFTAVYWFYWYFIKNNHIVYVKKFGADRWLATRGQETYDKRTKKKGFSAPRMGSLRARKDLNVKILFQRLR